MAVDFIKGKDGKMAGSRPKPVPAPSAAPAVKATIPATEPSPGEPLSPVADAYGRFYTRMEWEKPGENGLDAYDVKYEAEIAEIMTTGTAGDRSWIATNGGLTPYTIDALVRDPDEIVRASVARLGGFTREQEDYLIANGSEPTWHTIAYNGSRYSPEALDQVVRKTQDPRNRKYVAVQKHLHVATMEHLANDPDPDVRDAVAVNPGAPHELLERLAASDFAATQSGLAVNMKSSDAIKDRIISEGSEEARRWLARLNKVTPEQLERLSRDPDSGVRVEVLRTQHAHLEQASLERMAFDPDPEVRKAARKRVLQRAAKQAQRKVVFGEDGTVSHP